MQFFPVTTASGKAPSYSDDFNPDGIHGRKHRGIDIFADEGTPLVAVDDGAVRFVPNEGTGGNVIYLKNAQGVGYVYLHLSRFEGDTPRNVRAGDVVGYVGKTGNAQGTSPHCHFEVHPTGTRDDVTDPYPLLQAATMVAAGTLPTSPSSSSGSKPIGLAFGAKALAQAYELAHGTAPTKQTLLFPLAQANFEGTFGPTYAGTNNWGSMHAVAPWAKAHAKDTGYGMIAHIDSGAYGHYITRLQVNPSPLIGASAFLARVESAVGDLSTVTDVTDYATRLYTSGYYEGKHTADVTPLPQRADVAQIAAWTADDRANIADYAAGISAQLEAVGAGIDSMGSETADPAKTRVGPPFAALAHRLTSWYEPHTMERARELLGKNADDPPPNAISIADAQAAPNKDGVWLFGVATTVPQPKGSGPVTVSGPGTLLPRPKSALVEVGKVVLALGAIAVVTLGGAYAASPQRKRAYA